MQVIEILNQKDQGLLELFMRVATQVYQSDPVWVPQSEIIFQQRFAAAQSLGQPFLRPVVCVKDDQPLARAVAILDADAVDDQGRPQGYIAFFECQVPQAGRLVVEYCERLLRERGACSVQAPRLDNMLMGLLVNGFDLPQTVLTQHNPPHYQDILLSQGYQVREYLCSYIFTRESTIPFTLVLPGFRTRTFDRSRLDNEARVLNYLQQEIFRTHPGYVPRSLEQDRQMIESFLPTLDDELVIIAEDHAGCPVGLLICLPDIYQAFRGRLVDSARLISIGAIPRLAYKGIGVLMGTHLARTLLAKGYHTMEASWIRESNVMPKNLAKRFKGQPGREFALFEKSLVA
jgi:hypothetical protein